MTQNSSQKKCYTIGYGDYPINLFVCFLQFVDIDTIIDVRSSPYSRYNPYFNQDNLEKFLRKFDIEYLFMGDKIGGRYSNPNLLYPNGTVNYLKVQNTETFQEGINRLLSIISSGKKIALMCAEKEPERCHRFALISRVLQSKKIKVTHIRPEIRLQTNEDLEKELIKSTFDNRQQIISDIPVNAVDSMYERLNKKIAYKIKDYNQSPDDNGAPHVASINLELKKQEISDIQCVNEPDISSSHAIENLQRPNSINKKKLTMIPNNSSANQPDTHQEPEVNILAQTDSFTEKNVKREVQKTLF